MFFDLLHSENSSTYTSSFCYMLIRSSFFGGNEYPLPSVNQALSPLGKLFNSIINIVARKEGGSIFW